MVRQLDHLNLTVHDLADSEAFYAGVLGFERVEGGLWNGTPWAILRAGEAMLCLYEHPEFEGTEPTDTHRLNHFALRLSDPEAFLAAVADQGVEVRYGGAVHWPNSRSWYVADPTGHEIEVVAWKDDEVRFDSAPPRR